MGKHIVKRRGHTEEYDERKVYATSYRACLNVHMQKEEAEKIAAAVCNDINAWIADRENVTSDEIFQNTITALKKHNTDASFMYETHRDIS